MLALRPGSCTATTALLQSLLDALQALYRSAPCILVYMERGSRPQL